MTTKLWTLAALGAALGLIGCKQESAPETKTEEVQPSKPPPVAEVASAKTALPAAGADALSPDEPTTVVDGVPTPEDFAEEAQRVVSADALEAELDRLEAEIGSD